MNLKCTHDHFTCRGSFALNGSRFGGVLRDLSVIPLMLAQDVPG